MNESVGLLIAEDDAVARRTLEFIFQKSGYEILIARDGLAALKILQARSSPLISILDVLMPGMDGIEVCENIRATRYVVPPYIILLTVQDQRGDILRGLEAGADDYVTKPFDADELQARVRVGARILGLQNKLATRVNELEETISRVKHLQSLLRKDTCVYEFGPFRMEAAERRLFRNSTLVPVTTKIFDLLLLLVQNRGHLIRKEEIMQEVWPDSIVEENNLTVTMSTLRRALGEEHGQHGYIETIPKRGYRFVAEVRQLPSSENAAPDEILSRL